jgi:hypothetical protein
MRMTTVQREELESVLAVGYDGSVSARAQMILWTSGGRGPARAPRSTRGWRDER